MMENLDQLQTEPFTAEREWTVEGIPILSATVSLPQPVAATDKVARRIRRYYQLQGRSFLRYCESWLFPQATAEYHAALLTSAPLPHFHADLTYRVTYNEGGLWSLYTQSKETSLPGRPLLSRRGDVWDLAVGYPVPISSFFPKHFAWRKKLLALAEQEIQRQEAAGIARYHEDWRKKLRKTLNGQNYYLVSEGLTFFFPMYAIAPAMEGIPAFTVPFDKDLRFPQKETADTADT